MDDQARLGHIRIFHSQFQDLSLVELHSPKDMGLDQRGVQDSYNQLDRLLE